MLTSYEQRKSPSFWKKILLILVFFTATPISLFSSIVSLVAITNSRLEPQAVTLSDNSNSVQPGVQIYASLPSNYPSVTGEVLGADARPEIIRRFLDTYNSPLEPYATYIVEKALEYQLDWRLTTAIAMKESGLGKAMPSPDCNNAWGWAIHSEGSLCFDSWEEGIDEVSRGLKENYIDKGYVTVEEIMKKYAHPDSTTWADGVLHYMDKMK
jgi:hypothetical protein